jgi:hypothetical protein
MGNDFVTIPRYLVDTLRPQGYFRRFYALVGASSLSHIEAFEAIENERDAFGLPPGYDNYQSFKRCKTYHNGRLVRISSD